MNQGLSRGGKYKGLKNGKTKLGIYIRQPDLESGECRGMFKAESEAADQALAWIVHAKLLGMTRVPNRANISWHCTVEH